MIRRAGRCGGEAHIPGNPGQTPHPAGRSDDDSRCQGRRPVPALIAGGSYPAILGFAFVLFQALATAGLHVTLASHLAAVAAAVLITLVEIRFPYRVGWRPGMREAGADAVFMMVVQIALPYLLSITLVVSVAVQACLMLLAADLVRYWLHRAFHRFTFMWRHHAVHHSPHRLYWLNVGRFHPIEKALQLTVDTLPFALLGVANEVLAAYLVFYAVNGFFQHSNCNVRLGPLNYIVSGPELHRWHHSELAVESNRNFGNNLIVWDLLFGTRFLPSDREVGRLGLINRKYPTGFFAQMKTPFVPGLDKG